MAEFLPERTIRYKTNAKRVLVDGLSTVFRGHPDDLLQRTKVTIEFPRTEADYPAVVVRFYEREIFNAGVGHQELIWWQGESDSVEIEATMTGSGSIQLNWARIANAIGYKVYKGTASNHEDQSFLVTSTSFIDDGRPGTPEGVPTTVTAELAPPQVTAVVAPSGNVSSGQYFYRVTALTPSEAIKFQHYFYTADIELAVYALSAYDRDLVADTLVQTIAMGRLESYTNTFFSRVYPPNDLFPDSELHFIGVNSDRIQGFGESQSQTPWGAEDDLLYSTSYRFGVFGELYSLPPDLSYAMVQKVTAFPYIAGIDPLPTGTPGSDAPWVSNALA